MTTARALVLATEARFEQAGLVFGHGTGTARDEAVFLVLRTLGLPFDCTDDALDAALPPAAVAEVEQLVARRIGDRIPAAYLTGVMWFAGLEFEVNPSVLVPRSPFAELIVNRFEPWLTAPPVMALEIGTGSGCIAAALAIIFPDCQVHATDISAPALAVAARNLAKHGLERRVTLEATDLYPVERRPFDLIVTNPPYVPDAEVDALPPEFHHEPVGGLKGGPDGMELVVRIVDQALDYLSPNGILIVEVGHYSAEFESRFPSLEVIWLSLENGGEGMALITRDALLRRQ